MNDSASGLEYDSSGSFDKEKMEKKVRNYESRLIRRNQISDGLILIIPFFSILYMVVGLLGIGPPYSGYILIGMIIIVIVIAVYGWACGHIIEKSNIDFESALNYRIGRAINAYEREKDLTEVEMQIEKIERLITEQYRSWYNTNRRFTEQEQYPQKLLDMLHDYSVTIQQSRRPKQDLRESFGEIAEQILRTAVEIEETSSVFVDYIDITEKEIGVEQATNDVVSALQNRLSPYPVRRILVILAVGALISSIGGLYNVELALSVGILAVAIAAFLLK